MDTNNTNTQVSSSTRTTTLAVIAGLIIGFGAGWLTFAVFRAPIKVSEDAPEATTTTINKTAINPGVAVDATTIEIAGPSYEAIKGAMQAVAKTQGITDTSQIDAYVDQFKVAMPEIVETRGLTEDTIVSQAQSGVTIGNINSVVGTNDLNANFGFNQNVNITLPNVNMGGGGDPVGQCPGCAGVCVNGVCISVEIGIGGVKTFLGSGTGLYISNAKISIKFHF